MGKKKKCPWITDEDGTAVADSQFIIEHLIKKHNLTKISINNNIQHNLVNQSYYIRICK